MTQGTKKGTRILRNSIFRVALLYMALSIGSVVILLGFIYWATAGYADRQIDATIEAEIGGLAEQYRRRGLVGLTTILAERVARDPGGASVYLLADKDLNPLIGNLSRWPDAGISEGWIDFVLRDWGHDRSEEHQARARTFVLRGGLNLLVGRDVRDLETTRERILSALGWGLAITAALALAAGLAMGNRVMRRIDAINQTSRDIMGGDLSRRVPTDGSGDDFDELANNLNRMLGRIEQLMETIRQVSDNIAHDLRTPLTRLRTRLELARSGEALPREAGEAVDRAIDDAEELLTTFNALLRIARIESRSPRGAFASVDLTRLVRDLAELYEPLAADRSQRLEVTADEGVEIEGDRDLLFQAAANLVDNAIKHSPGGSRIALSARLFEGRSEIRVADSGPGIPGNKREKVFQRFFRLDESRNTPGSGLGLSLVRAVADLHGASVHLEDNEPGLRVRICFRTGGVKTSATPAGS
jgi:signal transduction histidine kinase